MKNKLIKSNHIYVDSKSGVTGAGAKPKDNTHFPEVFGNFSAYGISTHRHTPEIMESLKHFSGLKTNILFTPHLLPIDRGILTTTYSQPTKAVDDDLLTDVFEVFYKNERYVRVVNQPPSVKNVRGSNFCDVYVTYDERTNTIITVSAIDNLVKGAAGQAIQNMNIMLDKLENTGLKALPLSP
jgi:N-acetyl-gamma-glutamyl-phosphate reductase